MQRGNAVSDRTLLQKVNQRLARTGTSQARITATVRNGDVTLAGTIHFETQRHAIVKAAGAVADIGRVIDQLTVQARKKSW